MGKEKKVMYLSLPKKNEIINAILLTAVSLRCSIVGIIHFLSIVYIYMWFHIFREEIYKQKKYFDVFSEPLRKIHSMPSNWPLALVKSFAVCKCFFPPPLTSSVLTALGGRKVKS